MSVREAIVLLKAMLGEARTNAEEEESAICTQFNNIQVRKDTRRGHTETRIMSSFVSIRDEFLDKDHV